MTRLVFVDRLDDAAGRDFDPGDTVVAVTAAAADGLEACGKPYVPICDVADARSLSPLEARLCRAAADLGAEIETFVQREAPESVQGAGWLTGQIYHLQYSLQIVAARSVLMRQAIRSLNPDRVAVFQGPIDPWFTGTGYELDPWLVVLAGLETDESFGLEILQGMPSTPPAPTPPLPAAVRARRFLGRRRRAARVRLNAVRRRRMPELEGARALFVGNFYDWTPVVPSLIGVRGVSAHSLPLGLHDDRPWTHVYRPSLNDLRGGAPVKLDAPPEPLPDAGELSRLRALFHAWLEARGSPPRIDALGTDIFPGIEPHLRAVVETSPALARHADAVVESVLRVLRPEVVCAFALPSLPSARLSMTCRQIGVPVLIYQHGGRLGTERLAQHEVDLDRCDRMLTYGEGIFPRSHVLGGSVAQLVPVGSAKVERERRARRHVAGDGQHVRVLVLGESSSGNTLGASFALEDTERYRVEREVIDVLANSPRIRVTYRPFPIDPVATAVPAWIARDRPDVAVALAGPKDDWSLRRHFAVADVAVTALSSGTVWNEALAVDVPLVVYCDPRQTILADDFAADLDQACLWARTSADFIAAARRLADDPDAFLADLRARNAKSFLERYVLHRDDGRCVERALEALAAARASSGSPAREEAAQSIRSTDQVNAGRM